MTDIKANWVKKDYYETYIDIKFPIKRKDLVPALRNTATERIILDGVDWIYNLFFDGTYIWALGYRPSQYILFKIDPENNNILYRLSSFFIHSLAFDGKFLWLVRYFDKMITLLDINTNLLEADILLGDKIPKYIIFDGEYMWVTISQDSIFKLIAINSSSYDFETIKDLNIIPKGMTFDGKNIWIAAADRIVKKINSYNTLDDIDYYFDSIIMDIIAADGYVWVAEPRKISYINPSTGSLNEALNILSIEYISSICLDSCRYLWYTSLFNTVTKFIGGDFISETFGVGRGRKKIVFDGTHIWVGSNQSNALCKIPAFNLIHH